MDRSNNDEIDKMAELALDERNRVMIRSLKFMRKMNFERIVVIMGTLHYDDMITNFWEEFGIRYVCY